MNGRRYRARCVVLLSAGSLWTASALAAPEAAAPATETQSGEQLAARDDFREASRLAQRDEWAGALARYAISQARFPHATTLYNIGYCHERLGDFAAALRDTHAALTFQDRFPGRGLSDELRHQGTVALRQLESKVSTLEIIVRSDGLALRVDGHPLETFVEAGKFLGFVASDAVQSSFTPVSGSLLLRLNAGEHVLEWRSDAGTATRRLALGTGSGERLLLPEATNGLPAAPAKPALPPVPGPASTAAASAAPERRPPSGAGPLRPFAHATFVASGGAALLGLGAGWLALQTKRDLDAHCGANGDCAAGQADAIDRYHTAATVATIAVTSAVVLAGAGLTLLLLDSPAKERAALELRVSSQVELTGRF
ncbi:MAG TPA: hypothetical protein VJV79_22820 [Polyangiaceae bacterium]|nr:hypothetical protein [Polyangiaceae bacterium]